MVHLLLLGLFSSGSSGEGSMDGKECKLAAVCKGRRLWEGWIVEIGKIQSQYQSQECLLVMLLGNKVHHSNSKNKEMLGATETGDE